MVSWKGAWICNYRMIALLIFDWTIFFWWNAIINFDVNMSYSLVVTVKQRTILSNFTRNDINLYGVCYIYFLNLLFLFFYLNLYYKIYLCLLLFPRGLFFLILCFSLSVWIFFFFNFYFVMSPHDPNPKMQGLVKGTIR